MTVYTAKKALTKGIEKVEVEKPSWPDPDDRILFKKRAGDFYEVSVTFTLGVDAFERRADAEKKAEEMRERKIESLCRQIDKLKRMTFDA